MKEAASLAPRSASGRMTLPTSGFTLVEILVVLALLGVMALIGYPALMNVIRRSTVETAVREVSMQIRAARLEAIKQSDSTYVQADIAARRVVVWRENDAVTGRSAGDEQISAVTLPSRMSFTGPPADVDATVGMLPLDYMEFLPSGAAAGTGPMAIRLADERGNYLEVRVDPPATAKVTIRKHLGTWKFQGEGGQQWNWL